MLEVIRQDYIMTARAKGMSERDVIYKHALRNALLPAITILGLSIPGLIAGVSSLKQFRYSGNGAAFLYGSYGERLSDGHGHLLIGAILTLLGNLIADVAYCAGGPSHKNFLTGFGKMNFWETFYKK